MAWDGRPATWTGALVGPDDLNKEIRDRMVAMSDWQDASVTWTATGGTPTLGDGALTCQYLRYGYVCEFVFGLLWGSTTAASAMTAWRFTLPVEAAHNIFAFAAIAGNAGIARYACTAISNLTTDFSIYCGDGETLGSTIPFAFGEGDYVRVSGIYRTADEAAA